MSSQTANEAIQSAPQLGTAIVNIAIAAQERAFALNMSAVQRMLSRAAERSEEVAAGAPSAGLALQPVQPSLLMPQPATEPVFRYVAELLQIYQGAASAIAELLTAQTRGEQQQFEALTSKARNQASEAASTAVNAAGSVLTTGIEVTNRLTSVAAQAGQSLAARVAASAEEAGRSGSGHPGARRAQRSENGQGKQH